MRDEIERRPGSEGRSLSDRHRAAAEPLYALEGEERTRAFEALDREWALTLDFEGPIRLAWAETSIGRAEMSLGGAKGSSLALIPARSPAEEGADLPTVPGPSDASVRVSPERFRDRRGVSSFFRHEFGHLEDLRDPGFRFDGDRRLDGGPSVEALVRQRYRSLWCAAVDAGLESRGFEPLASPETRAGEIAAAFGLAAAVAAVVRRCLAARRPSHPDLLACAVNPRTLATLGEGLDGLPLATAIRRCPACRLPAWPECPPARDLTPDVLEVVRADLPGWCPEDGLCPRCREAYLVLATPLPALPRTPDPAPARNPT